MPGRRLPGRKLKHTGSRRGWASEDGQSAPLLGSGHGITLCRDEFTG